MSSIIQKYIEACVFVFQDDHPRYLLLRRSGDERVYPGVWQFITGSIEGEERAVEAAVRELKEETNLVPRAMWIVPYVNSFYDQGRDAISLNPVFAFEVEKGADPMISAEHEQFQWLKFEEALDLLVWPGQREALRIVHEFLIKGKDAMTHSRIH